MSDKFTICLRRILQNECGYPQPDGPPWVRTRDGAIYDHQRGVLIGRNGQTRPLPTRPDGMAYDDDPDDTGGRTCMGVLQRVYDGYRRGKGQPTQDVWRIADSEITEIYHRQYWAPMRGGELPDGIDLHTVDMGVNAGIGTGARILQRALGVSVDGHIGSVTLSAAREANPADLLARITVERDKYYRQCRTFWKHGKSWLARSARTEQWADEMLNRLPVLESWETTVTVEEPRTPRADNPPPSSMVESSEGNAAIGVGASGTGVIATEGVKAAQKISEHENPGLLDFMLVLAQSELFWLGLATVVSAAFIWFKRRARLGQGA